MDDKPDEPHVLEYRGCGSAHKELPPPAPVEQAITLLLASLGCTAVPIFGAVARNALILVLGLAFAPWLGLFLAISGVMWVRRQPALVWAFTAGILVNAMVCLASVALWTRGFPC